MKTNAHPIIDALTDPATLFFGSVIVFLLTWAISVFRKLYNDNHPRH